MNAPLILANQLSSSEVASSLASTLLNSSDDEFDDDGSFGFAISQIEVNCWTGEREKALVRILSGFC